MGGVEPEHDVATSVSSIGEVHTLASEAHVSLRSASTFEVVAGARILWTLSLQHVRLPFETNCSLHPETGNRRNLLFVQDENFYLPGPKQASKVTRLRSIYRQVLVYFDYNVTSLIPKLSSRTEIFTSASEHGSTWTFNLQEESI